ncbi:hypothetical protein [Bacillus sp. 1P06AnD]|uniref:hypothetical protein n=1 Tax=Bacillus sp. 1P06AnD TaxID=3132208 RepID=UPI0039A27901
MVNRMRAILCFSCLFIFFAGGCKTTTLELESHKAIEKASYAFQKKKKSPNEELKGIRFYRPFGYKVKEKSDYTIVMERKGHTILLFVNPQENRVSETLIKGITSQKEHYLIQETFEKEGSKGMIAIKEMKDDAYEMLAVVGGVKVTAQLSMQELSRYAGKLMEIASSVNQ